MQAAKDNKRGSWTVKKFMRITTIERDSRELSDNIIETVTVVDSAVGNSV